jgi:hypothetical protein
VGQALSNLIDNRVMLMMALKRDYEVTDQEVTDHISRFTAFQTDGRFDQKNTTACFCKTISAAKRSRKPARAVIGAARGRCRLPGSPVERRGRAPGISGPRKQDQPPLPAGSRQVIDQRVEVDEAEANKYFTAHRDKFVNPEAGGGRGGVPGREFSTASGLRRGSAELF